MYNIHKKIKNKKNDIASRIKRQNKQGLIWHQPVTIADCLDIHRLAGI